jgi:hypothetical protein
LVTILQLALHIDIPTRAELGSLLEARDPASVSIHLPTSVVTQEARADRGTVPLAAGRLQIRMLRTGHAETTSTEGALPENRVAVPAGRLDRSALGR